MAEDGKAQPDEPAPGARLAPNVAQMMKALGAAKDEREPYVSQMLDALEAAQDRYVLMNPTVFGGLLLVLGLAAAGLIWEQWGRDWSGWVVAAASLGWAGLVAALVAGEYKLLHRYRKGLERRLASSGIAERLALGPEALPDIYRYVPFPWTVFLGARPRTLTRWVRLIGHNLEWYLGEPRPLLRLAWVSQVLVWVFQVGFILSMGAMFQDATAGMYTVGIFTFLAALYVVGVLAAHQTECQRIALTLLHKLLSERFNR